MGDPKRGLYQKFVVRRVDGTDNPGGKHDGCEYFVLDCTHDRHAIAALRAYGDSCAKEYPKLALDLFKLEQRLWDRVRETTGGSSGKT